MSTASETRITTHPACRQVRIKKVGADLELSYRQLPGYGAYIVLVWLIGWTCVSIWLVCQALNDPGFPTIWGTTGYLLVWFFVFGVVVWTFFGVERVRLGLEGLEYRVSALITLSRRLVPRAELKNVRAGVSARSEKDSKPAKQLCLRFETRGRPIEFACGISKEEQLWLVGWLNEYLDALGPHGPPERHSAGHRNGITADPPGIRQRHQHSVIPSHVLDGITAERTRTRQRAAIPVEPPADTRTECRHHRNTIEFVWRGRWNPEAVTLLTFFGWFWNGCMAACIYRHIVDFNWFLFFFTLPHEIAGLCMFGLWLIALTAPLWEFTWTFGEREATRRLSIAHAIAVVFDLSWSKRFDIQPPIRIKLRRREEKKFSDLVLQCLSHPAGDYTLVFVGGEEEELFEIDRLTEGDARWITAVLLRAFPSWKRADKRVRALNEPHDPSVDNLSSPTRI